ncbi:MAG: recombination protein RecR [Candidatus Omnitrophica bacterium]|nr:recombination protein RecR [Candidatus Omnitrophota bacterium]
MKGYSASINYLIQAFARFPGIGPRTAERMVFYLLKSEPGEARRMAELILRVKEHTFFCERCFNLSESKLCHICLDESREAHKILVVEDPKDVAAFEKSGIYRGLYHVLVGHLSPQDGIGPEDIRVRELFDRVEREGLRELILATSARSEGEATSQYIAAMLAARAQVRITRIARGIPVGHPIEFADQATLARAFEGRQEMKQEVRRGHEIQVPESQ